MRDAFAASLLLLAVAFGVWPLWQPGWPLNHELLYFAQRTAIYAAHFAQGDFLPLWSAADNLGFGSAQPALYHKLFYFFSGALLWLAGDIKLALSVTTAAFLLLGAAGLYALLRWLDCFRSVALAGGVCLIFANYTLTNWLVRGALAEFSAAMLIPWVLLAFLRSLRGGRADALALGVAMALLFLAHSLLAYFLGLFLLLLGGLVWRPWRLRVRPATGHFALAGLAGAFLLAPGLYAMQALGEAYDLARILPPVYQPRNQLQPLYRYFWDEFAFGAELQGFTVQLDLAPLVLLLAAAAMLWHWRLRAPLFWAFSALAFVVVLLQSAPLVGVYDVLPGGLYIQFPWRLLAIATPLIIAAAMLGLQTIVDASASSPAAGPPIWLRRTAPLLAIGVSLVTAAGSGAFAESRIGRYSEAQIEDWLRRPVLFSFFGEYLPRSMSIVAPPFGDESARWAAANACWLGERQPLAFESLTRSFRSRCSSPARLALPLVESRFHAITINGVAEKCQALAAQPGLCAVPVPAGIADIRVRLPTIGRLFGRPADGS